MGQAVLSRLIYSPSDRTMRPSNARPVHYDGPKPALGSPHAKKQDSEVTESLAADILSTLHAAEANDEDLVRQIEDIVHETGWYEDLAAAVLNGLEATLKAAAPLGEAMKDAYDLAAQAVAVVWGFAQDHPVFCALVALGILVILVPWAVEALGFAELGPVEGISVVVCVQGDVVLMHRLLLGTFASWWQSTYRGYVPARSLFSYFQRLGMKWAKK